MSKLCTCLWHNGKYYLNFDKTPFHPQGGGQVGDKGWVIIGEASIEVLNTVENRGVIFHEISKQGRDTFLVANGVDPSEFPAEAKFDLVRIWGSHFTGTQIRSVL